jgi:alpha(1,3/1,4) fucosyltransferase
MNKTVAFYAPFDKRIKNDGFLKEFDDLKRYAKISTELTKLGFEVHSLDVFKKQKTMPSVCVFLDIPPININKLVDKTTKSIAILREPELISRENFDKKRHKEFDLILTWKKSLIDHKKYLTYPSTRIESFSQINLKNTDILDRKLCVLINSDISSKSDGELYSFRKRIVNWFSSCYPEDFDLWGYGWDKYKLIIFKRTLFHFKKPLTFIPSSYQGATSDKFDTLSKYKFSICFENTNLQDDYISEKIFDAFLSQNVPIYYGAPNVTECIPKECFIDYRDFKTHDELYDFIKYMSSEKYLEYLDAIKDFLSGFKVQEYSLSNWEKVVKDSILKLS